jgi:hypothetical protein
LDNPRKVRTPETAKNPTLKLSVRENVFRSQPDPIPIENLDFNVK